MKSSIHIPSKRAALFTALFLLARLPAFAQITITGDQFANAFTQSGGFTSNTYNDTGAAGLQSLVIQAGANQTWSFQGLPFVLDTAATDVSSVVAYPGGAAEASSFTGATHVQVASGGLGVTEYTFYKIDQTGAYLMGTSQDSMGTSSITEMFTPAAEFVAFPLTSQTPPWTSSSTTSIDGFPVTIEDDGSVDGWGTVEVPGNNSAQCIRVKVKTTVTATFLGNSVSYSFLWVTQSAMQAEIDADTNQNATNASYTLPGASNIVLNNTPINQYSLSIASNPISAATSVSFTLPSESGVRISLMDPLGRESQVLMNGMAHSGVNTLPLDPANLMNGTYFLRIESAGNSSMQKVIVAH
jgi:hypothetical protein